MHRLLYVVATGCGTYSMVRPAQTLPPGKVEIAAGLAASELEVNTVVHIAVGVADRVEILGQNEIWNTFGEVRVQVLRNAPVDVVVGAGGGYAITFLSALTSSGDHDTVTGAAGTASIAIGRDWGSLALTLGNRSFFLASGYLASSTRAGLRVKLGSHLGLLFEGGATVHAPLGALDVAIAIGEATGGLFLQF
jgi:hypothetical protein